MKNSEDFERTIGRLITWRLGTEATSALGWMGTGFCKVVGVRV